MGNCCSRQRGLAASSGAASTSALPGSDRGSRSSQHHICAVCKTIPFNNLPSEDEQAWPHQPSYDALKTSAKTCSLCVMILHAVDSINLDISGTLPRNPRPQDYAPAPGVQRQSCFVPYSLPDGSRHVFMTHLGYYAPAEMDGLGFVPSAVYTPKSQLSSPDTFKQLRPWLFGGWWKFRDSTTGDQLIGMGVRLSRSPALEHARGNNLRSMTLRGTHLRLRVQEDSPLAGIIPGRLRTISDRPFTMQRIARLIQNCDDNHSCNAREQALPTRVLDVGSNTGSQTVRLVETAGKKGRYIALSHCWGKGPNVTTTNQNYNQHLSGIPLSSLSQKFKDAIEITRFLKQRFLWIDSLCIIQPGTDKDMTDWEREASKMADVYQKSWLTIASAGSGDNLAGCVDPYDPSREHIISPDHISLGMLATPPPPFTFMTANGAGVLAREGTSAQISANGWGMITITEEWMPSSFKSQPMTYSIGCFGQKVDVLGDDPLSHRGWTLQERALSPRTLHLSRNQLFFECTRGITSEDGSRLPSGPFPLDVVIDKQLLPASEYGLGGDHVDTIVAHGTIQGGQHVGIPIEGFPPPGGVFGRWDGGWLAVVQNFSNRMLSESKDKLPALSGFARAINAWTGEEYLAGLWRDHIFEDLNWMVLEREEHTMMLPGRFGFEYGKKFRTPVNPQDYRAPSWSWASLDASVEFVPLDYTRIVAILVDVHINRSQTDPFGQVGMGCRIHLEAPLIEVRKTHPDFKFSPIDPLGFGELVTIAVDGDTSYGTVHFDLKSDSPHFPCFALFLDSSNALILRKIAEEPGAYIRIGVGKFLRTRRQKQAAPLLTGVTRERTHIPYGPVSNAHRKVAVTIY